MATISQIFSHSNNQQSNETAPKQQQYIGNTQFTLKIRHQQEKTKSNKIKTPHRLKKERNTDTSSLMQCMTNQRCLR
jgi:hypothetical protein